MRNFFIVPLLLISLMGYAQQTISLEECYDLVEVNYPLAQQKALLDEQLKSDVTVIQTQKLPKFDFSAQATYQSEVTKVPIPNSAIKPLNKDQYKATLTANQLIFGGGIVAASLQAKEAENKTKQQQVEVTLYQLKSRVNELYFSILLLQEKNNLLLKRKAQLQAKLKEVRSGVENGALLPASDKVLEAELLKVGQQQAELAQNKVSLYATLASLAGKAIDTAATLQYPEIEIGESGLSKRPEYNLFRSQKERITASEAVMAKDNMPKLFGFATGGYGNPGLNMLDNSFQPFYIVGLKLSWNIFDWDANKKKRESLQLNANMLDTQEETFTLNTQIEQEQQVAEIAKLEGLIASDQEIIRLRQEVLETSASQLRNGVITSSAYITDLTSLYEAENEMSTHKIQVMMAKANYNIINGN